MGSEPRLMPACCDMTQTLARRCMATDPDERPTFSEIIEELGEVEDDPFIVEEEEDSGADANGDAAVSAQ